MAKTLVTLDKKLVNYANIVSISVEHGDYSGDDGEEISSVYGLIAFDVTNSMHVLGVYEDREKAVEVHSKLKSWLECEAFGVYDLNAEGDD